MTKRYEELLADMTGIVAKIYEKGYDKGYEQGKFDQRLETAFEDVKREVNEETPQAKRDRIVERAKKDVRDLASDLSYSGVYHLEFIVNKEKRTIVALIHRIDYGYMDKRGITKAHPNDCFNVHIGKAIALRRALGLEVPNEYLNAPQPTEVRVGDVVRMKYYNPVGDRPDSYYVKIIDGFDRDKVRYEGGGFDFQESVDKDGKIIDDSREEASK